jgi:hypothetical protein
MKITEISTNVFFKDVTRPLRGKKFQVNVGTRTPGARIENIRLIST